MKSLCIVAIASCFVSCTIGQTVPEKLDSFMQATNKYAGFNGTVLVAKGGQVLLEKGYGFRNAETKTQHDVYSVFQIGSLTKQFTGAVIQQLVLEGKLSVNDTLNKYFPEYLNAEKITIAQLLHHVSGIYNYTDNSDFMQNHVTEYFNEAALWKMIKDKPLNFTPGSRFNYSNSGYLLLGYIIQKVTAQPYETAVRKYLFEKAGMTHSGFDFTHLASSEKTTGYLVYNDSVHTPAPIVDSTVSFSAGAIYSTVEDLYKWNTALNTGKILPEKVLESSYSPFLNHYGYGLFIDSVHGKRRISHAGGIHGFVSYLTYLPVDKVSIIVLSNSPTDVGAVEKGLEAIVYGNAYTLPAPRVEKKIDTSILKAYVGEYQLAPTFTIKVFLVNGGLKLQATNQPAFDLFATDEDSFFLKVVDARVDFIKNERGEVEKLVLHQNGQDVPGKKIK
jgi:CubicO group peptidase (beta-lactamase class C family)